MLAESPTAFGTDLREAKTLPLAYFRGRASDEPESFIMGAFSQGNLIGCAGGFREEDLKRQHIAQVVGVFIHPDHRGAGLSRRLVSSVLERLERLPHIEQINLAVTADNEPALALYLSFGFEIYGREPAALKVEGTNYDELLLSRPCS